MYFDRATLTRTVALIAAGGNVVEFVKVSRNDRVRKIRYPRDITVQRRDTEQRDEIKWKYRWMKRKEERDAWRTTRERVALPKNSELVRALDNCLSVRLSA